MRCSAVLEFARECITRMSWLHDNIMRYGYGSNWGRSGRTSIYVIGCWVQNIRWSIEKMKLWWWKWKGYKEVRQKSLWKWPTRQTQEYSNEHVVFVWTWNTLYSLLYIAFATKRKLMMEWILQHMILVVKTIIRHSLFCSVYFGVWFSWFYPANSWAFLFNIVNYYMKSFSV